MRRRFGDTHNDLRFCGQPVVWCETVSIVWGPDSGPIPVRHGHADEHAIVNHELQDPERLPFSEK